MTIKEIIERLEHLKESAYENSTETLIEDIDDLIIEMSDEHSQDDGFLADDGLDEYLSRYPN